MIRAMHDRYIDGLLVLSPIVYADLTNCNEGAALHALLIAQKAVDQHTGQTRRKPDFPLPDMAHRHNFALQSLKRTSPGARDFPLV
jgi:hypothetical protein